MQVVEFLDKWNIDAWILVIVFLSGLFQEKYMTRVKFSTTDARLDGSLKTLAVSAVAGCIYLYLMYRDNKDNFPYVKYFVSYFAATSIYDLAVRPIRKWITRMTNKFFPEKDEV